METGRVEKFEWLGGEEGYLIARGEIELPGGVLLVEWAQGEKEGGRFETRIGDGSGWAVDGQNIEFSSFWIKSEDWAGSADKGDFIDSRFRVWPGCKIGEGVLEKAKKELVKIIDFIEASPWGEAAEIVALIRGWQTRQRDYHRIQAVAKDTRARPRAAVDRWRESERASLVTMRAAQDRARARMEGARNNKEVMRLILTHPSRLVRVNAISILKEVAPEASGPRIQ